jgi:L-amino acid N-acyltransferase YncA
MTQVSIAKAPPGQRNILVISEAYRAGRRRAAMRKYAVREATDADQEAILDIYNDAVVHSSASFELEPRTWEGQEQWFQEHHAPHGVFVVVAGETVAGWGSLSPFRPKPGYRFTAEDSIYVHKDFRGQGIGAALLDALIEAARRGRLHCIVALIDGDNAVSVRLHERVGFQHVGVEREVGHKFGRWLDVVQMQKMLE